MQADDHPVEVILKEARRFMVPFYQRKYQWADPRILPFWEDVEVKASEVLDREGREGKFKHYMGALILSPVGEAAQIGVTPKVQVVDGQQRLTTFQLFLAALREVARQHNCDDSIKSVNDYLFNSLKSKDKDPLTRFKLTPTPSDRGVFHDVIDEEYQFVRSKYTRYYRGDSVPKNTHFRALRAYEVFRQKIEHFANYGPTNAVEEDDETVLQDDTDTAAAIKPRLEALLTALLSCMKLVVIMLDEGDDAQVIFETLNSKGEPLLAMDLVRNNIFHRAEKEEASIDELYRELWDPFDDPWWRESAPSARPRRPRIDHFLSHTLAAETGERISMRELYAEYRAFVVPKGPPRFASVKEELWMLQHYAPFYETLEGRKKVDEILACLGSKLSAWQVTTAYPVAMQLMQEKVSPKERKQISRLMYSYIVRRTLSGLTSKNLNKVFQSLARRFVQDTPSTAVMTDYFATQTGSSTRFPNDQEFRQGILEKQAYRIGARIKDVLWELELACRTDLAEPITEPTSLWTEHVLPQTWNEDWPFVDGVFVDQGSGHPKAQNRNRLVHTLGNLTLLSGSLNISSGNRGFAEKQSKFKKHTKLFLNDWFKGKARWTEIEIRERGEHLADLAIKIWPGP